MKIFAIILIIVSLSKLCLLGSQDLKDTMLDLYYKFKENPKKFVENITIFLCVDSFIGLISGLFLALC